MPTSTFRPMLAAQSKEVAVESTSRAVRHSLLWQRIVEPVEPFLKQVAERLEEQVQTFHPDLREYARYALTNQGKQLRPALVALAGRSFSELNDDHVNAAVIIEMVHLATLVHDDVMDEASVRRSRPTLANRWSNELAVLLGDCLFAHSLELAASFETPEVCRVVSGATKRVCSGEILQTQSRLQLDLKKDAYFQMLAMKTGELFGLSCDLGAYMSGIKCEKRNALRQYGLELGTAYQLYDDCLDLFGTEKMAGKSLGTDLAKGKLTLPIILSLQRSSAPDRARLERILLNWSPAQFPQLLELLETYHGLSGTQEYLGQHLARARARLEFVAVDSSLDHLEHLLDYLAQQTSNLGVSSAD